MRVRLLLLLALFLLLGQGCTRQYAFPAIGNKRGSGSYRFNGHTENCRVDVSAGTIVSLSDSLVGISISMKTVPSPDKGYPVLILDYHKPGGQPDTQYQVALTTYLPGGNKEIVFYEGIVGTLTETSPGVFAGTFTSSHPENSPLTAGTFTGARLRKASDYR